MDARIFNRRRPSRPNPLVRKLLSRRAILLVAPAIVAVAVLMLSLHVLPARAFGDLEVDVLSLQGEQVTVVANVVTITPITILNPGPNTPVDAVAGSSTAYQIRVQVRNTGAGTNPAEAVRFEYRAPAGITITSIDSSVTGSQECEIGTPGNPLDPSVCQLGNMSSGASHTITIKFKVKADVLPNPAVPSGDPEDATRLLDHDFRAFQFGTEDDPPDNETHALTRVKFVADLEITRPYDTLNPLSTKNPWFVYAGTTETFQLRVVNHGPSWARAAFVTFQLLEFPGVIPVVGASNKAHIVSANVVDTAGASCSINSSQFGTNDVVRCHLGDLDPLPFGERIIELDIQVDPDYPADFVTFVPRPLPSFAKVESATLDNAGFAACQLPIPVPIGNNNCTIGDPAALGVLPIVLPQYDVTISKTSEPDKVYAGEQKKYTITVENLGPSDAPGIEVSDTLPVSLTYEIDTDTCAVTGTGANGEQQLTCTDGTLPPGGTWQFDVWALVDPAIEPGTTITNTAQVSSLEYLSGSLGALLPDEVFDVLQLADFNPDNDTATTKNLVLSKPDLRIVKFGKPDGEVRAGEVLTYTTIVDNLGPSWAHNVVITDVIQAGGIGPGAQGVFTLLDVDSDRPATCGPLSGTFVQHVEIRCALDEPLEVLTSDAKGRWIVTTTVTSDEPIDIDNVAHVTTTDFDPNMDNNLAIVEHDITAVVDLQVHKESHGQNQIDGQLSALVTGVSQTITDSVTAGLPLLYTVVVTNAGPSTAENVVLQDRLPPGIVVRHATTTHGDCITGTPGSPSDKLTCGLGTLPPNDDPLTPDVNETTATIVITADVSPSLAEGTILENDVVVFSDRFDPTNTNNFTHTLTTVNTWADLVISKTARGDNITSYNEELQKFIKEQLDDEVTAGELLQYTLVVSNTGPSDARSVVVTDTLPPPAGPIATVHFLDAEGATCRQDSIDRNELTCELGYMPVGDVRTVYILVRVDPAATDPTGTESPPDNNEEDILNVARVHSATNDPYDGPPPAGSGDNNVATNTTHVNAVADIFITGVDVPAEPPAGSVEASNASAAQRQPMTQADVPAKVRLDEPFEPDKAIAGNEHRYLITFGNNGPSVARDVVVTDTLDLKQDGILGETFVRCEPVDPDDQVTCAAVDRTINGTVIEDGIVRVQSFLDGNEGIISGGTGTLNPGDEFSFWLITEVDPGYVLDADDFLAENTAWISSSTTDVRLFNNEDTEQTVIIAQADLTIDKMDSTFVVEPIGDPVEAGGTITYTINISNTGPSDAAEVLFTDWLPSEGIVLVPETIKVFLDGTELDCDTPLTQPTSDSRCFIRDDGRIQVIVGDDPNNQEQAFPGTGEFQRGRLNAHNGAEIQIVVLVGNDAEAGTLLNRARVETRQNNVMWPPAPEPFPGIGGGPRTPTADPDKRPCRLLPSRSSRPFRWMAPAPAPTMSPSASSVTRSPTATR
jgi:uncharacterized repeat protein (TIGR01451 family)